MVTLLLSAPANAQTPGDESQVKAGFVYNFLKFVQWPAGTFRRPEDPIVFAIVGEGPTVNAAEHFLAKRKVGARPLAVRRTKWDEPLAGTHAMLVIENDEMRLRHILKVAASEHILSIGEGAAFATHGGVIGMLVEERKMRFDIDTDAAALAGLKISAKLLALTRVKHSAQK